MELASAIRAVLLLALALALQYLLSNIDAHDLLSELVASASVPLPEGKHTPVAKSFKDVNKQQAQSVRAHQQRATLHWAQIHAARGR